MRNDFMLVTVTRRFLFFKWTREVLVPKPYAAVVSYHSSRPMSPYEDDYHTSTTFGR